MSELSGCSLSVYRGYILVIAVRFCYGNYNDIAFLADLMGHESIETTRIYLRKTATEQQHIVDKIVTW